MQLYNNIKQKIYKNGVLYTDLSPYCSDGSATGDFRYDSSDVFIGVSSGITQFFKGEFDDFRIYSESIPESQIKLNYVAGLDSLLSKNLISREEYDQRIEALGSR